MTDEQIMIEAIAAGDGVLINEQAALLRECRFALYELLKKKPMMASLICGSTTLGNLRASLYEYRPQGVFGGMCAEQMCVNTHSQQRRNSQNDSRGN